MHATLATLVLLIVGARLPPMPPPDKQALGLMTELTAIRSRPAGGPDEARTSLEDVAVAITRLLGTSEEPFIVRA